MSAVDTSGGRTATAVTRSTATIRAFDFTFRIRASDPDLVTFFDQAWSGMRWDGPPRHEYEVIEVHGEGPTRFALRFDGVEFAETDRASRAMTALSWHINRQVLAHRGERYVLHAAAAEVDGRAVLIPAAMESGKTTLVAGLITAGFKYLTDEATALDPVTLEVEPYAKPLSVDQGSWDVLRHLRPAVPPSVSAYHERQWQVAPSSIAPDAVGRRCQPRWIVTTSYRPDEPTELRPMSGADTVRCLASSTFGFTDTPGRCLDLSAELARRCRTFRLVVSDLDDACHLLLSMVREEDR